MNRTVDAIEMFADECRESDLDAAGPYGDYVASVGYGEAWHDVSIRNIEDDDLRDELKALRADDPNKFRDLIRDCTYVQPAGLYIRRNEVYSLAIGETEHQLPDDILAELDTMTAAERAQLERQVGVYMRGNFIYIDHSDDRMVLILDTEQAREYLDMEDAV